MPMELHPFDNKQFYFGLDEELGFYNRLTGNLQLKASPINGNGNQIKIGGIEITHDDVLYVSDFENITSSNVPNADNTARISRSFNNGTTWEDLSFNYVTYTENGNTEYKQLKQAITWKPITDIESDPLNPDQIWISVGGVYKSTVQIIDETLRVIKSNDGGDTWIDFSEGLPAFPVNTIIYDSVSETLFAGTDAGIFYRHPYDNTMTEWDCFSEGMPIAIVTDLEINNCTRTLFASTDSRGLFKTPIPFTELNGSSIVWEDDHLVTTEEVWDTDRYFDGEIMVSIGGILRINSRVELTENSRIVVLPGGQLFLSDTLIGSCNEFWEEIQLRGNANMPQTNQYQGALRTLPGATIINAENGVANYGYNTNGVMIENSQGGIAIISDAVFLNNKIAVEFNSYQNLSNYRDASVITKSKFLTTANYYSHDYPETPIGVQIINNNQISISQNEFTGLDYSFLIELPDYSLFPKAINCWNSSCVISNNEFTHLDNAVYAMNYFPNEKLVKLDQNLFYECYKSVYLNGISNAFITRNRFGTFVSGAWNSHDIKKVQIYLDQCPNFVIEEDTINYYGFVEDVYNIGIIINNCGSNNNKIYRNKFFTNYDILVQGINRDATGDNGLEIKCNNFRSFGDIGVSDFNVTNQSGLAANQGSNDAFPWAPAGNLFTTYHDDLQYHFWNLDEINNEVTYWHHNPYQYGARLRPGHDDDNLINNVVREGNYQPWDYETSCPSNFIGGGGDIKERLLNSGDNTTNLENTLNTLTDGGNTDELSEEVNEATEAEAFTLRNELLNTAPYTSDQVLVEATEKEEVLSNPLIRDVLVANPQAAKDETVLDLIENRQNPMPDYMKQQIINGQTYTGAKEQLEAQIHQNKVEYTNALTHLSAFYFSDTTIVNPIDSILLYLMEAKNIESHYQLAGIYLQENNITAMNSTLNAIANNFTLDNYRQTELQDLTSYYSLLANLKNENRSLFQLSEAEKQQLLDWHHDNTNIAATYARNILIHIGEIEYEAHIILPDMGNKSALLKKPYEIELPNNENSILNIYPNPSKDYFICEYDIKSKFNNACILIVEAASGKSIKKVQLEYKTDSKTIDLIDINSGSYIISLQIDGNVLDQKKMEIVK